MGAFVDRSGSVDHDGEPTPFRVFTVIEKTSPAVIAGAFPNFAYRGGTPYMLDAARFRRGGMEALLASCERKF